MGHGQDVVIYLQREQFEALMKELGLLDWEDTGTVGYQPFDSVPYLWFRLAGTPE